MSAVRAVRCPLCLPEGVDRNSAREVLEFATRSSYPTAGDPLLAVAHAAAQVILAMHDEIHAMLALKRAADKIADEVQRVITNAPLHQNSELTDFAQRLQWIMSEELESKS